MDAKEKFLTGQEVWWWTSELDWALPLQLRWGRVISVGPELTAVFIDYAVEFVETHRLMTTEEKNAESRPVA